MKYGIVELHDNYAFDTPISYKELVRCKECKWASPNKEGDYDCKCHIPIFRVDAEGYCYLADRKESE